MYGARIVFSYKFGGDGSGSHAQYRAVDADEIDQNTMFISMFCAIRIHAEWTDSEGNVQKSVFPALFYNISFKRGNFLKDLDIQKN